jgi:hypothetical protein
VQRQVALNRARQDQALKLIELALGWFAGLDPRRGRQLRNDRIERRVGVVGRALVANTRAPADDPLTEDLADPRLADPSLARQDDNLPLALIHHPPTVGQQADFWLAADKRRQQCRTDGGEAAFVNALVHHLGQSYRFCYTLEPQNVRFFQRLIGGS